ncbi:MAG: transglutaminase domain-containing protein [Owenweeksia sp.]
MKQLLLVLMLNITGIIKGQLTDFPGVNFSRADSIAVLYQGANLSNLPQLTLKLTHNLPTEVEKFRALYTWICRNIENDYLAYQKNKRKRELFRNDSIKLAEWNRSFGKEMFHTLYHEQKTVCTGYAWLLQEMANLAGIPCKIINGYARTSYSNVEQLSTLNHSWNAVKLNGKWYLCDPTWSSGNLYEHWGTTLFVQEYNEGFFLTDPAFFFRSHYPEDSTWTLLHQKSGSADFLDAPIVYNAAFKHRLNPITPQGMHIQSTKRDTVLFSFRTTGKADVEKIYLELHSGSHSRTAQPTVHTYENGVLVLRYRFTKTGYYDLHLKIGDEYIATYTASVTRH